MHQPLALSKIFFFNFSPKLYSPFCFYSDDLPQFAVYVDPLCSRLLSIRWQFGASSAFVQKVQVSRLQIYCAGLSRRATGCKRKGTCSVQGFFICCGYGLRLFVCCFPQSFLLFIAIALRKVFNKLFEKIFQGLVNKSSYSELHLKLEICILRQRPYLLKPQACRMQF